MRKGRRVTALAAVVFGLGIIVWSGCGGGRDAAAPPEDQAAQDQPLPVSPGPSTLPDDELRAAETMPVETMPVEPRAAEAMPVETGAAPPEAVATSEPKAVLAPRAVQIKPLVRAPLRAIPTEPDASPMALAPKSATVAPPAATRETVPEAMPSATVRSLALAPEAEAPAPMMRLAAPADAEYQVVDVFYGTDRNAISSAEALRPFYASNWFTLAAAVGALTLVFLAVRMWIFKSRTLGVVAGVGIMATVALGAITTLDYLAAKSSSGRLAQTYGTQRGEFALGTCQVSIPKRHEIGKVERPSIFRGEIKEDPRKHVMILSLHPESVDEFYAGLNARVEKSKRKEAFVFVHGFNVSFADAATRTAQLAYDLEFDGPPIFYSWPSQCAVSKYTVDETNVVWTVPHLKQFLLGVARKSGAESVHLVAHSMGNRALTSALESIATDLRGEPPIFREVLLTAPDIDADVFRRDIAPAIVKTAERVTLYASSNDGALVASKQVHGYPRAGDSGPGLVVVEGIDTIDVSRVDTSLLGHSYYGDNHTVIADMLALIRENSPPDRRPLLVSQKFGQMLYWVFTPDRVTQPPAL